MILKIKVILGKHMLFEYYIIVNKRFLLLNPFYNYLYFYFFPTFQDHIIGTGSTSGSGPTTPGGTQKFSSALKVRVPSELEGIAYIQVI